LRQTSWPNGGKIRNQPDEVARRFALCYVGDVVMSAITFAELEYGVSICQNPASEKLKLASLAEDKSVLPFDQNAAHAVALDVVLVTNNLKDFAKYPGLKAENGLEAP
jgi:tRNA(fMet)-specific endonuclease VapC